MRNIIGAVTCAMALVTLIPSAVRATEDTRIGVGVNVTLSCNLNQITGRATGRWTITPQLPNRPIRTYNLTVTTDRPERSQVFNSVNFTNAASRRFSFERVGNRPVQRVAIEGEATGFTVVSNGDIITYRYVIPRFSLRSCH